MRIAQVAPLMESVPPKAYGGTERVVSYLTEALVELGHDVTLYASGDSVTEARLVPIVERAVRLDPSRPDWLPWTLLMVEHVFAASPRYDVIHFHIDYLHFSLARRCTTTCVTTLHGRQDFPELDPLYRRFDDQPIVAISESQRAPLAAANWCGTVHHGLPRDLYRFHERGEGYFAFVGRASPEKRIDRAIEIAIACGRRLRIAAKVGAGDETYFESLRPRLAHPLVEFVGELLEPGKNDFIGGADALLFPIDWPEPFGLVMIEALACGTPVIAYPCGAVPEVLVDGETGFVVRDQQQAIAAARRVHALDRRRCREAFERRFTARGMAERYIAVYRELLERASSRRARGG